MKNMLEIFCNGLEIITELFSAIFMILLLGIISILDCVSLIITSITLRIIGVILVISILYYFIH